MITLNTGKGKKQSYDDFYTLVRTKHSDHSHYKIVYGHFYGDDNTFFADQALINGELHNKVLTNTYYEYNMNELVNNKDKGLQFYRFNTFKEAEEFKKYLQKTETIDTSHNLLNLNNKSSVQGAFVVVIYILS